LTVDFDKITSLAKRRGFVFQGSEIYGGLNGTWDFGPLGVELLNNVKRAWWRSMTQLRDDIVGVDAAILMASEVWRASGHVETFTDPLVDCRQCKMRFRADQLDGDGSGRCPNCGGELTEPRQFNLMFKTFAGPVEEDAATVYLRPETAQGIFVNFQNVQKATRRLPFGIAQIGKSFRNEISPGNFFFRSREFEQMECEYFVPPAQAEDAYRAWIAERHHRQALCASGRDRHPLLRHRRLRLAGGPRRHRPRTRLHGPAAPAHRRPGPRLEGETRSG